MTDVDDRVTVRAFNDEVVFEALRTAAMLSRPAAGLSDGQLAEAFITALGPVRVDDVRAVVARLRSDGRLSTTVASRGVV